MNKEQLYINNVYIPLSKSINASITKSITDLEKPEKRNSTYSKSAIIPNSPEAQEVFGDIFEINLVDGSFNPTVKADVLYTVDGDTIIDGYCQLKEIIQRDEWEIEYSIVMFGTISNIFNDMGEEELVELYDFSDTANQLQRWNHPFTREVQQYSWATQVYDQTLAGFTPFALGTGYVYPLIDYGFSTDQTTFTSFQMPCALYAKEYVDAIFAKHGYTYTSSFFDSTYFKSLIIPSSPRAYNLTDTEIANREFSANTPQFSTASSTSGNLNKTTWGSLGTIEFTNELSDAGGNYNPATGVYTAVYDCIADFSVYLDLSATFTPDSGTVDTVSSIDGIIELHLNGTAITGQGFYITYDDFGGTKTSGARSTNATPTVTSNLTTTEYLNPSSDFFWQNSNPAFASNVPRTYNAPNRYYHIVNNVYLQAGDTLEVKVKAWYRGLNGQTTQMFRDGSNNYIGGNATLTLESGGFYNHVSNTSVLIGDTLTIDKIIPKNIKQKDFFLSLVKMFNLWIDVDPLNSKNLLIEPRNQFLGSDVEDIQELWARDRDLIIEPAGKLDATDWIFTYKQDKDFYNQTYEGDWQRIYGDRELTSTNDFVSKQNKIEVIFSPTPLAALPNSDRVMSTILELDNLNYPKPADHNIRILYYGGLKTCYNSWNHTEQIQGWPYLWQDDWQGTYPYAGHFDDPFDPDEDLNFGLVNQVYYDSNINGITVTNNNLVNKYWLNMVAAYTDSNTRIVKGYFNVQPSEFKNWTFDKLYFFNNAYHRLQAIEGYNPTGETLTKCVFLKIEELPTFTAEKVPFVGDDSIITTDPFGGGSTGGIDTGESMPVQTTDTKQGIDQNNTSGRGVKTQGVGNYVDTTAFNIEIQGDGNNVRGEAENIKIQGDNNTIYPGIRNVTLINTSDTTVTESNTTYINGVKLTAGSIQSSLVEEISSNTSYDPTVKAYVVDTSGGNVTVTFDLTTYVYPEGAVYYIKKDDPANTLIVSGAGCTIDGAISKNITGDKSTIAVISDGTNFQIV